MLMVEKILLISSDRGKRVLYNILIKIEEQ